jgi:hypothetical protein
MALLILLGLRLMRAGFAVLGNLMQGSAAPGTLGAGVGLLAVVTNFLIIL